MITWNTMRKQTYFDLKSDNFDFLEVIPCGSTVKKS